MHDVGFVHPLLGISLAEKSAASSPYRESCDLPPYALNVQGASVSLRRKTLVGDGCEGECLGGSSEDETLQGVPPHFTVCIPYLRSLHTRCITISQVCLLFQKLPPPPCLLTPFF